MIRDVIEFRRSGLACRRVAELDIPVQAWRAAMRHAGRRGDARVHTFLVPPHPATPADRPEQVVYAVRTNPPPEIAELPQGLLWWRRVDQLDMPVDTVRAVMHRVARREGVGAHTFLAPPACAGLADPPGQLVYAVWAQPGPDPFRMVNPPPLPPPRPVASLAAYAARRTNPSTPDHHPPIIQPERRRT